MKKDDKPRFTRGISPMYSYSKNRPQEADDVDDWYTESSAEKYQRMESHRLQHKAEEIEEDESDSIENPHYGLTDFQILRNKLADMNPTDPLSVEDASKLLELIIYVDTQMKYDSPEAAYIHSTLDRLNLYNKWNTESVEDHTSRIRWITNKIFEILERIEKLEGRDG